MKTAEILDILQTGTLEVEGLLPWSSNYTFLARVCRDAIDLQTVYKPRRGERPLWDFERGTLCLRERAAFVVSNALGWKLIPPTVLRQGPNGFGSVQLFINHDPERHYFTFEGEPQYQTQLQQLVLLDVIINNADRKAGHVLIEENHNDDTNKNRSEQLWGIDHGICFHTDYKLRTVIWEFAGLPIPPPLLTDLRRLQQKLFSDSSLLKQLNELLSLAEIDALQRRVQTVLSTGTFREPGPGRHYPWPPV